MGGVVGGAVGCVGGSCMHFVVGGCVAGCALVPVGAIKHVGSVLWGGVGVLESFALCTFALWILCFLTQCSLVHLLALHCWIVLLCLFRWGPSYSVGSKHFPCLLF